jgi:hypothetical protein
MARRYTIGTLVILLSFFVMQGFASEKDEDELDARFSWTIKWEEEIGESRIQEKGSCIIQMSGKIVKYKEDEEEDDSEFLRYVPKGMKASYKYSNKWYNIDPHDKCYGVVAEENAIGSVQIKSADEASGPNDGAFELQALLGFGGQMNMLQWIGSMSPDKIMNMGNQSNNDNYVFKLFVPFKTKVQKKEDCYEIESSLPRSFLFQLLIAEYKKKGMSGSFTHPASAHTFQELGYGSCGGVTRFTPSEGRYNTTSQVSWDFGKVATLQISYWDRDLKDWVKIDDDPVDITAGEKVKLKAKVLPEDRDPKKGDWVIDGNNNENYIKEFKVSDDQEKSEVIKLKKEDLQKPEIEFYWFKGEKGTVKYSTTVDGKEYSKEVEFTIRKPEYTVELDNRPDNHFGVTTGGDPKLRDQWPPENRVKPKYKGKLGDGEVVEGLEYNGILFSCKSESGIQGKTQWVQIIENCQRIQETGSDGQPRKTPPIDENCKKGLDKVYPCARNNSFYDAPSIPTSSFPENRTYFRVRMTFDLYLMFKPEGEGNEWIPLKKIDWKWDADVQKTGEKWGPAKAHSFIPKNKDVKLEGEDPTVTDATEYPIWNQIVHK